MIAKKNRLYLITGTICFFGIIWLGFLHYFHAAVTLCPVKNLTGYPCPSCGSSRAIDAFLHGNIWEAILINPLGIISLFLLASIICLILVDLITKRDYYFRVYNAAEEFLKKNKLISVLLIILLIANWIWNIKKGL